MRIFLWVVLILIGLIVIVWLGFQAPVRNFGAPLVSGGDVKTIPLPAGLPAPVERFYRTVYGDSLPVYTSVVLTGHARIRPMGPWYLPARTRFIHEVGTNYRHYIEVPWFGIPILKVEEGYIDGASFFENALLGSEQNDPETNQGANLALWAEAMSFPSLFVTDPRARWEPVDDNTALLRVPFGEQTESFVVRFDPRSHLMTNMEVMRYQGSAATDKTLWIPTAIRWGTGEDIFVGNEGAALWANQAGPWAYFTTDEIVYNGDVHEYIRARGQ